MAIIGTDEDQNDPSSAAAPTTGGEGAFVGSGGGQGATTTTAPSAAPSSSGSFTNLSNYLSANQGSGDKMAGTVGGVVNTSGQVAEKARGAYQNEGLDAVKGGTVNVDQGVMNSIKNGTGTADPKVMASITGGFDQGSGSYSGPGSVPDSAKYRGPDSYNAGTYTGPDAAATMSGQAGADRSAYQGLADTLSGHLKNANGGQAGIAALEKGIYQQPSYTAGENNLDAFLTGGSGAYQQGLKDMNTTWGGEADRGKAADASIDNAITAGKKTSTDTQSAYNTAIQTGKEQSAAAYNTLADAIKAQQAKQAAWAPKFDEGVVPIAKPAAAGGASHYNPLGIASPVPGAVAKAGKDIANAPKQNQAQPATLNPAGVAQSAGQAANKEQPGQPVNLNPAGIAQKAADEVGKYVPKPVYRPKIDKKKPFG